MAAEMNRTKADAHPAFSDKQGQYLAFIHAYTVVPGRPPAEADLQRHFRVTPPSVHQMILMLERSGFIERTPGTPRSIRILVDPDTLPTLHAAQAQTVKSPVQSH
jgi:SOS-response transcriptional repressor LexA